MKENQPKVTHDRRRVMIEGVMPEIDGGRHPAKRCAGDRLIVEADIFADSHEALAAVLLYRFAGTDAWRTTAMEYVINDRWKASFTVNSLGRYEYTIKAWIDRFATWRGRLIKKIDAGQEIGVELQIGIELIKAAAERAKGHEARQLTDWINDFDRLHDEPRRLESVLDEKLMVLMKAHPDLEFATTYEKILTVDVNRPKAGFSSWYEFFPRSCGSQPGVHGTFADCEARLPRIAEMGFDVLYLPPIHPIGQTHRKGPNNSTTAAPGDPGSPWAIGSHEGGHKAVHPRLGTLQDFKQLVARAQQYSIDIALDIAFQCSPDHPYTREHPEWFYLRPDGRIQYAENPPKKYEDIYPLNFESEQWRELWQELKSVFLFWIEQGVRIFRVDNPHTKSFNFWEWVIREIKKDYPDTVFLSEAFTRPKVMYRLAKLGFDQSYTYFTWRNTKWELTTYFSELTRKPVREYFRPNLWPNTPDILTEYLQVGGRPAFMARLVLAATLGANYGIYGPAFELQENRPREFGGEEYLDSEKYQLRFWDLNQPDSLQDFIAQVNRIRKENPALQDDWSLRFHSIDNDQLICYSKQTQDQDNIILVVVNLDPYHTHSGWLELPLQDFGLNPEQSYQMHDLLSGARFLWYGAVNYIELAPHVVPAHIFRIRRRLRTERDFDYFM